MRIFVLLTTMFWALTSCAQPPKNHNRPMTPVNKTEEEWKKTLTPEQYRVLRGKGTEAPWSGKFNKHKEDGLFTCAACGAELFTSKQKFDSGCGWPSFDNAISNKSIITAKDYDLGYARTEIMCANCGGHLGHVFDDGPTETGLRYCVNSVSIDFKKVGVQKLDAPAKH